MKSSGLADEDATAGRPMFAKLHIPSPTCQGDGLIEYFCTMRPDPPSTLQFCRQVEYAAIKVAEEMGSWAGTSDHSPSNPVLCPRISSMTQAVCS